jgi:hypothetical protein
VHKIHDGTVAPLGIVVAVFDLDLKPATAFASIAYDGRHKSGSDLGPATVTVLAFCEGRHRITLTATAGVLGLQPVPSHTRAQLFRLPYNIDLS